MAERRKFARIPLEKNIRLKFKGKEQFVQRLLKDISLGGMFLKTLEPIPLNTQFNFEFSISDDLPTVKGRGLVVRTTKDANGAQNGVGIKFIEIEGDGKKILSELIKKYGNYSKE